MNIYNQAHAITWRKAELFWSFVAVVPWKEGFSLCVKARSMKWRVMEDAHIFAQDEMDERRLDLHLDFPEEPIQGNGAFRDFHVQEELRSCLLMSEELVLLLDFLRDWNLKRKSEVKKTESDFISSSDAPPHWSDLAREGDFRLLSHARSAGFPFSQSKGCPDLTSSVSFLGIGVFPEGKW